MKNATIVENMLVITALLTWHAADGVKKPVSHKTSRERSTTVREEITTSCLVRIYSPSFSSLLYSRLNVNKPVDEAIAL